MEDFAMSNRKYMLMIPFSAPDTVNVDDLNLDDHISEFIGRGLMKMENRLEKDYDPKEEAIVSEIEFGHPELWK
jgi:hypothetical protein